MQPAGTLGEGIPEPTAPLKSMPDLWPIGTLEDGLPPGAPEVPNSQTWRVECPQGHSGAPGEVPTSPQAVSPTLQELFQ